MSEVTATEAARKFADLLYAVEQNGERYTITRRVGAVAHELANAASFTGSL